MMKTPMKTMNSEHTWSWRLSLRAAREEKRRARSPSCVCVRMIIIITNMMHQVEQCGHDQSSLIMIHDHDSRSPPDSPRFPHWKLPPPRNQPSLQCSAASSPADQHLFNTSCKFHWISQRLLRTWEFPRLGLPGLLSDWTAATRGAVTAGWQVAQLFKKSSACLTSDHQCFSC